MRWAQLVLAYLHVLVWPIVTVAGLAIFRSEVRTTLGHFTERLRYLKSLHLPGGTQFDYFDQASLDNQRNLSEVIQSAGLDLSLASPEQGSEPVGSAEASAEKEGEEIGRQEPAPSRPRLFWRGQIVPPNLADEAQYSPQTTIVAAWQKLEAVVRQIHREFISSSTDNIMMQASAVCSKLHQLGRLNNPTSSMALINRLHTMCMSIEHLKVTKLEAYDYASTAYQMSELLLRAADAAQRT